MAQSYFLQLNNNDDFETVIKKCNANFKTLATQKQQQDRINKQDSDNVVEALHDDIDAVDGKFNDYTKTENLAAVALSNDYSDLDNLPTIPPSVVVDDALDNNSENPVQNKVIADALDGKADTSAIPDVSTKVSKTGDQMTGELDMMNHRIRAVSLNSNMKRDGSNPIAVSEPSAYYDIRDVEYQLLAQFTARRETDGTMEAVVRAYNDVAGVETTEEIRVGLDRNGNAKYYVTTPSALLAALGLVTDVDNSTLYIGTSSSWTLWSAEKRRFGNVVTVLLQAYCSSALTAGTTYHVGNVPSAWRPAKTINGTCSDGIAVLTDAGSFSVLPFRAVASNTILHIYFTFIV